MLRHPAAAKCGREIRGGGLRRYVRSAPNEHLEPGPTMVPVVIGVLFVTENGDGDEYRRCAAVGESHQRFWGDADDGVGRVTDVELFAEDVGIASVTRLPKGVTENDHG